MSHITGRTTQQWLVKMAIALVLVAGLYTTATALPSAHAQSLSSKAASLSDDILFIHGFNDQASIDCNSSTMWGTAENFLRSQGFTGAMKALAFYNGDHDCFTTGGQMISLQREAWHCTNYYAANIGTVNEDIRHLGCELAWFVWDHYAFNGHNVQIVAHSMGGLIVQWALYGTAIHDQGKFPSQIWVQNVVTIATPHGGIPSLGILYQLFGPCNNCVQYQDMQAGSDMMNAFVYEGGDDPQGAGSTWWTMLGSSCDPANTLLNSDTFMQWGTKIQYFSPCYDHGGYLTDTSTSGNAQAKVCDVCQDDDPPASGWQTEVRFHALQEMSFGLFQSA